MLQSNPDPVDRYWPTLGLGVGGYESLDHPVLLPGMVAETPDASPDLSAGDKTAAPSPRKSKEVAL